MDKSKFYTPHIKATPEDFAKTVLMPGDPLRAKFIAENYLDGAVLVNSVRGINGYTGTYKGQRVSVMASGMVCPRSAFIPTNYTISSVWRILSAWALSAVCKRRSSSAT